MELVNIKSLANHFNLRSLMDLFRIDWIIEKIKNFKFFVGGEPREIIKDSDEHIYYLSNLPNGMGIVKVLVNEETVKFISILKSQFYALIGKTYQFKQTEYKKVDKSTVNEFKLFSGAFILAIGSLLTWKSYDHYKHSQETRK